MRTPLRMVEIIDYDPAWPREFRQERQRILRAIPHVDLKIEHVGSTAVAKLAAKPIVDILVGVPRLRDAVDCIPRLSALGYRYVPGVEVAMPYRRFFWKHRNGRRTHHVHVLEPGHEAWRRHIVFRDYLRTHADVAREYEKLKRRLARKYRFAVSSYTHGKTEFVHAVLERACREHERRRVPVVPPVPARKDPVPFVTPPVVAPEVQIPLVQEPVAIREERVSLVRPPVTFEAVLHAIAQAI